MKKIILILLFSSSAIQASSWDDASVRMVNKTFSKHPNKEIGWLEPKPEYILNVDVIDLGSDVDELEQLCPNDSNFYNSYSYKVENDFLPWADAQIAPMKGFTKLFWEGESRGQWVRVLKSLIVCYRITTLIELTETVQIEDELNAELKVRLYEQLDKLEICLQAAKKRSSIMQCQKIHKLAIESILRNN